MIPAAEFTCKIRKKSKILGQPKNSFGTEQPADGRHTRGDGRKHQENADSALLA
jgi:hypothetical protein